jgi:hypothetical protein
MDQPNLFVGVGIAAAGLLTKRFLPTAPSQHAPIVPQLFWSAEISRTPDTLVPEGVGDHLLRRRGNFRDGAGAARNSGLRSRRLNSR